MSGLENMQTCCIYSHAFTLMYGSGKLKTAIIMSKVQINAFPDSIQKYFTRGMGIIIWDDNLIHKKLNKQHIHRTKKSFHVLV